MSEVAVFPAGSLSNTLSSQLSNDLATNAMDGTQPNGGGMGGVMSQAASEEHPDAPKIRRQVEYYFSDENLPTDLHLLQCCGGRENLPVSISRICGFKKMRGYKPKSIVSEALRKSTFLEVSADGKTVKRKVPLTGKCLLDKDYRANGSDNEIAYDPRTKREVQHPVLLLPQKKKDYPLGMTKNMMKPTGFEEAYVEGPIAPAEAEEEMTMYDPDKPFIERIEVAIQRFKQKRRMHEMYAKIFNKWMKFGGVDCEPRMFGGLSKEEMRNMNSEDIARAKATHHVPWDREDTKKWTVDFLRVGEAFLSSFYPAHYGHNPNQVKTACQVLRSFYNYLLFHQVCDEHRDQLLLARTLCDKADVELPQAYLAGNALPGAFNVAASTIFGGSHAGLYTGLSSWTAELDEEERKNLEGIGLRNEEAMVTFKTGVAAYGSDEQYDTLDSAGPTLSCIKVVKSESLGLEVMVIHLSTADIQEAYKHQNNTWKRKLSLQPLGKLICKPWRIADFKEYDLPKDKYPSGKLPKPDISKEYEVWVEDEVLNQCFVGMKIDATILTLTSGIVILDEVREVFCSFYKWIPNELWAERKFPKFRLLKKALPDVDGEEYANRGDQGQELEKGEVSDDFED